jgi:uncharacterized membrane protein YphA (DoxX/SURF4 family)
MQALIEKIRSTKEDKPLGIVRVIIGIIIFSTGLMKLLIPMLWNAWFGQLTHANIPFYTFNLWFVPFVEMITGLLLISGIFSRLGSMVVIIMMLVATYVHLVVDDTSLFPLQPEKPIIPIVLIAMGVYVLMRGGGSWSIDIKSTN